MKLGSGSRPIKVMPSSWNPKVDDHPNLVQWDHSIYATIEAAADGTLMNKVEDEAYNLIEENNF